MEAFSDIFTQIIAANHSRNFNLSQKHVTVLTSSFHRFPIAFWFMSFSGSATFDTISIPHSTDDRFHACLFLINACSGNLVYFAVSMVV